MPFSNESRAKSIAARRESQSTKPYAVDPATCEHDYTADELEFLLAMEAYKSRTGRKFPVWSEVLSVLRELGYSKPQAPA